MTNNSPSGTVTIYHPSNIPQFSPRNESWVLWKEKLEIHFAEINCTEENAKKTTLLKAIGPTPYETLHNLCSPASPVSKTYKELCRLLETHYTPPTIIFRERKNFHNAVQAEGETVSEWHARVKKLALSCRFGDTLSAFVLDRFIMGINNKIFERLCEEDEKITIDDALRKALIMEMKLLPSRVEADSQVNYLKSKNNKKTAKGNNNNWRNKDNNQKKQRDTNTNTKKSGNACAHCGWRNHNSNECRYKQSKCHNCGKIGHLASVCRGKERSVNYVSESNSSSEDLNKDNVYDFCIYSINNKSGDSTELYSVSIKIDGIPIDVVCDSGAPCSLVSNAFIGKLDKRVSLESCVNPYVDYNGNRIDVLGEYYEDIECNGSKKKIKLIVTKNNNAPLFGRNFLRKFGFELVQVNSISNSNQSSILIQQIKNEFYNVFDNGLGAYKLAKISLSIDDNAKPCFFKPRPVPLAWKAKIEKSLRELIARDVLEPIDHAEWGTPLVPILKPNGELRICGDYKVTINKYLCDFKYPLPLIDEIFASLQGGELFSKLDLSSAYNQLILDEKSQLLCTWSTHIGTLKMKRLPFGVKTAAAIFQKTMENLLRDIPFVVVYQDDITISGENMSQHICNLKAVLNKLMAAGLKLNLSKCEFFQSKISYLGFTIDKFGLSKNKERIESVLKAPIPQDVSELRAFLGMVNYYSKFIENFANKMVPLYHLLQKNVKYEWSTNCQDAYEEIKRDITSDKVLVHFNPKLPIVLTTDASNKAVAGILSHVYKNNDLRPIAFVSKALSKAEQNYSTIEKEALAIVFCVTKLKQYLIGNNFTLKTDHKPLISIFGENKGLPLMAAARVQRWAFILSGFNYKIEYIKGISNDADHLSRMPQLKIKEKVIEDNTFVNFIQNDNVLNIDFKDIERETRRDPILSKVCEFVKLGLIENLKGDDFVAYTSKGNELSVDHDCLLWGYRVVIPLKLRKPVLQLLHESHLGIVKTKGLARSFVWWHKIDNDIEDLIKSCVHCQKLLPSPEKSPLIPWKTTNSIWHRIHIDFAGPIKNNFLFVIIDSFSKWVEVFKTKEITSNFVITKLRETFCRFGIPNTIVSDNGRQFVSNEFKEFSRKNKINHVLTAPGHPATNGQAENFIKTLKKSIYANLNSSKDENFELILNRFLMDYRNTKHCTTDESPSKIFLGRSIRSRFDFIKPPLVKDRIFEKQKKSISNYKGKRAVNFEIGQNVFIRDYSNPNKKSWAPAVIKDKNGPRSYQCILDNNRVIKRHTDQIRSGVGESLAADNLVELNENDNAPTTSRQNTSIITVEPSQHINDIITLNNKHVNNKNNVNISEEHATSEEAELNNNDENTIVNQENNEQNHMLTRVLRPRTKNKTVSK